MARTKSWLPFVAAYAVRRLWAGKLSAPPQIFAGYGRGESFRIEGPLRGVQTEELYRAGAIGHVRGIGCLRRVAIANRMAGRRKRQMATGELNMISATKEKRQVTVQIVNSSDKRSIHTDHIR